MTAWQALCVQLSLWRLALLSYPRPPERTVSSFPTVEEDFFGAALAALGLPASFLRSHRHRLIAFDLQLILITVAFFLPEKLQKVINADRDLQKLLEPIAARRIVAPVAPARVTVRVKVLFSVVAEDELLEDEHERIYMIQAHAPWAETRFAKYLTVDTLPHTDDRSTSRGDRKTAAVQDVVVHQPHDAQLAKVQRRAAEAHWAETLRAARSANAGIKPKVHAPGLLQHKCDAGKIQQMQQNGRHIGRQRRCGGSCSWRPRTGAARRRGRRGRLWSPKYGYGD
ncbi:hypothetical protein B0H14DRAFT_2559635 [Mycena olivaceomarginata]|nr:hypothetical protein B0H14DRAFT_2559635 [Mycena olivaceomarginata]